MKLRVTVDVDVLAAAEYALAAHAASIAKHLSKYPESAFNWRRQLVEANKQTAAFKAAVEAAELVSF